MTDPALQTLLQPRSIGIIGASDNPNKVGGRPIAFLRRYGYRGSIFPINPARSEVQGITAFPELAATPSAPEVVIIAVPAEATPAAVAACAARGVKAAIVLSSGFGETGPDGRAVQDAMVATAKRHGMRLIGPNSQGLANIGCGAVMSFSTMFVETEARDGPVAIVSQSGAISVVPYGILRRRGFGVRHLHAVGNEADITVAELATAVAADPDVGVLLLYLESLPDPAQLAHCAELARARDLPIVALKSGRTASGQRAAASHTGALATEDLVVDAFFEQHGIIRADDIEDWVGAVPLYLHKFRPAGRRLVVISNSGATCVMAADRAEVIGLPLAQLAPATSAAVRACLPDFATVSNPIDITAALLGNSRLFSDILPPLAADPAVDLFLIGIPVLGRGYDVDGMAADTLQFMQAAGKPLALAIPQPDIGARFAATGVPVFEDDTRAIRALAQVARWSEMRRAVRPAAAPSLRVSLAPGGQRFLSEAEAYAALETLDLPIAAYYLCRDVDAAQAALRELGPPVVLKACSSALPHKSEHGLVRLNVTGPDALRAAFQGIKASLVSLGLPFEGVLVCRQVLGERELVIGLRHDARYGNIVLAGDGGKYVEVLRDTRLLLPPLDVPAVVAALQVLRVAPILLGARGARPLALNAFAELVVRLSGLDLAASGIASLDLNPVLLDENAAVIADALIERETN